MIYLITFINTVLNVGRGGRYFPDHWLFSKWAIVFYQAVIMAIGLKFIGAPEWLALLYIAPHALEMAIGTSEQMQAGNTKPFDIDMDKPLNQFLCWVLDIQPLHARDADKRRLGVWYCSVIGVVFYLVFAALTAFKMSFTPLLYSLPALLHGFIIGVYRYLPPITWGSQLDLRWRIFKEMIYFGMYTYLFMVAV